jgi:OTU domain-containing protein 6
MNPEQFEKYCVNIRDTGVWGGEPEILALSRAYNVPIHVVQSGSPPVVVHNPSGSPSEEAMHDKRVVRISYHRRMYGLGEVCFVSNLSRSESDLICSQHYNSLRPKTGLSKISSSIQSMLS